MSKQVSWQSTRGIAWRSLAGAACALAGVLAFELACRTWGWRLASPAEVPMLAALLGGLLWGIAGGLGAGALVAGFVLVALGWPERFAGLDAPLVLAASLFLPLLAGDRKSVV